MNNSEPKSTFKTACIRFKSTNNVYSVAFVVFKLLATNKQEYSAYQNTAETFTNTIAKFLTHYSLSRRPPRPPRLSCLIGLLTGLICY